MTLLAQGPIPDVILLEDADELCRWLVGMKRTVPSSWIDDVRNAQQAAWADSFF